MKLYCILTLILALTATATAQRFTTLTGTPTKLAAAYSEATTLDLTRVRDVSQMEKFVRLGLLVKLTGNRNYQLHRVAHPYLRPAGRLLVERLSAQSRAAPGEPLVVTSAVRTLEQSKKIWNASSKTVHPAGIAVDFRVPGNERSRKWLEAALLQMQSKGVVIATREHKQPHYHVVVLSRAYEAYVALKTGTARS